MPETLKFYMDVNVPAAVTKGLQARGITVITAQEDQRHQTPDPDLLDRAASLGCVLYTHDADFFEITSKRLMTGKSFTGDIYSPQTALPYGRAIEELLLFARCCTLEEMQNKLEFLPSR